jgi:hypothetical protein
VNQNIIVYANSRQIAIGDLPVLSVIYILFRPLEVVATRDLYVFCYPLFDKYRNTFTLTLILIISLMTITFQ